MTENNKIIIGLVASLAVVALIYILKSSSDTKESGTLTQADPVSVESVATTTTTSTSTNVVAPATVKPESVQRSAVRVIVPIRDCGYFGDWIEFTDPSVNLSFCYKKSWGMPKVKARALSKEVQKGEKWHITFPSAPNKLMLNYSTLDFAQLADSDVPTFCWDCLDFQLSDVALHKAIKTTFPENISIERISVNDRLGLKVNRDFVAMGGEPMETITWYIPQVLKNRKYNLEVFGYSTEKAEVAQLVSSLRF